MPACFHCNMPVAGPLYQQNGLHYCQTCFTYLFPAVIAQQAARDLGYHDCEECGRRYALTANWSNTRICATCEDDIRYELQQPAHDADLTPDERRYLARSLGTDLDTQDDLDAPFCQSCIKHGGDRKMYPCLREDDCGWERKKKVAQDPGQLVGMNVQITINASTSNATSNFARVQRSIMNQAYLNTYRSPGT